MKNCMWLFFTVVVAFFTLVCFGQPGPIEAGENITVVPTRYGKVRGHIDDGIFAFKGTPYAQAERFMQPKAPEEDKTTTIFDNRSDVKHNIDQPLIDLVNSIPPEGPFGP